MKSILTMAAAVAMTGALAQDAAPDLMKYAVNTPSVGYSIYGAGQTSAVIKDKGLPGGQAMQVVVTAKPANSWDIGATSAIPKPIAAGDRLLVAVWLRAPKLKAGETMPISAFQVNQASAPYGVAVTGNAAITNEWKMYQARGVATTDLPAGSAVATVHLGTASGTVALGPIFVLDFGRAPGS